MVVAGTHNPYLVTLSILVASFASYTALDLSAHVRAARGLARCVWLAAAAITMGGGIWSMHFIGILAFVMPIPMSYDIGLTTLSLLVAIFVTGGGFYVISRRSTSPLRLVLGGVFMGLGIAAMHYTGMAAMRGHAELSYDRPFVALSLVIAIGASTAALWLALRTTEPWQKLAAAVVMGLAISGMHYTAMRAAIFVAHGPVHEARVDASLDQTSLALAIAGITFVILAFASIASLSEQKRAEEALRHAQAELARISRVTALGELSASIAHEIRQPLGAIVASAAACLNWLHTDPVDLKDVREALDDIVKDGNRAADILSRIRALLSRSVVLKESCDLTAVVQDTLPLIRADFVRYGIDWHTSCESDLPRVLADRIQLQQVLLNLLMNAAEACRELPPERRRLTVHASVEYRDGLPWVVLEVEDSGIGFREVDTARVFEAFYSTKPGGLGMGLSISRSIIEGHGGRLWASTNADHGVTMHFALPCIPWTGRELVSRG